MRFVVRLVLVVAGSTAVAAGAAYGLGAAWGSEPHWALALLRGAVVAGADVVVFVLLSRAFHLREVTSVIATVTRKLGRG